MGMRVHMQRDLIHVPTNTSAGYRPEWCSVLRGPACSTAYLLASSSMLDRQHCRPAEEGITPNSSQFCTLRAHACGIPDSTGINEQRSRSSVPLRQRNCSGLGARQGRGACPTGSRHGRHAHPCLLIRQNCAHQPVIHLYC